MLGMEGELDLGGEPLFAGVSGDDSSQVPLVPPFWKGQFVVATAPNVTIPITALRDELVQAQRMGPRLNEIIRYLRGEKLGDILSDPRKGSDRLRERA